ncbi:retropepsin-like aspartic protease, partial [Robertmurraya kyonggiensis]
MVIETNVAGWELTKILIDDGSSADIIFASAFDQMNISRSLLQPSETPLIGFGGKRIRALGKIELPVTLGDLSNPRTERITFDVVDMYYPYNAIFGRGFLNTFEAIVRQAYLCMKLPASNGVITVFGNQQVARDIEQGITPGEKNVNLLQAETKQTSNKVQTESIKKTPSQSRVEKVKETIQAQDTKRVSLDPGVEGREVTIGADLTPQEEEDLITFLRENKDVFAWTAADLKGVSRTIIEHSLNINPKTKPRKQKLRKMSDEKV